MNPDTPQKDEKSAFVGHGHDGRGAVVQDVRPVEESDLGEYIGAVMRRWRPILIIFIIVFGLATAGTLSQKKIYESSAKLVVVTKGRTNSPSSSGGILDSLGGITASRNVDTQVEIINSTDLIEEATKSLSDVECITGFGNLPIGKWAYEVKSRTDTDVIQITTRAYRPEIAAKFANAIAQTYLSQDLAQNSQATRQAREYVAKEKTSAQKQLRAASAKLAQYQKQTGLVSASDQVSELARGYVQAGTDLLNAQSEAKSAQKKLGIVSDQLQGTAEKIQFQTVVSENPEFAAVRNQVLSLENQLGEVSAEYTPKSNEVLQAKARLDQERAKLRRLTQRIVITDATQANPVRIQLLQDYGRAMADSVVAEAHESALVNQRKALKAELMAYPEQQRRLAELQQGVEELSRTFSMLSERYYMLLIQERSSLANGQIADHARPAIAPSSPKVGQNLLFGFLLALGCGFAVAALLEKLDTKIHLPEEFERQAGLSALSFIPEATPVEKRLVLNEAIPNHAFLEGFRLLRNNITFATPDRVIKTIAVTSASMSEGKSTVSMNLAIAMAMDGKRVLIVDVDMRRPAVHKWIEATNESGLSSVVRGLSTLDQATIKTEWEGLSMLPSGPLPPNPTEFLNSQSSHQVLRHAATLYDVVILDAPPCTGLSDMQVISTIVDGVVVVGALDSTSKPMLHATMRLLRQSGAPLLGLVVNRVKQTRKSYYGYYGYYGYYSSYEQEAEKDDAKNGRRSLKK